jgi:hypothetical protein
MLVESSDIEPLIPWHISRILRITDKSNGMLQEFRIKRIGGDEFSRKGAKYSKNYLEPDINKLVHEILAPSAALGDADTSSLI